jgi:hypothetical protein
MFSRQQENIAIMGETFSKRSMPRCYKQDKLGAVSNTWQNTLQGLNTNNISDIWRITKRLTNINPNIPPLTINGKTVTAIKEKVNVFADTLEQIFTINSDADRFFTVSTEQVVNDFLKQPLTDQMRATNHSEIVWIVRHPKPRKAAGPEGIQNSSTSTSARTSSQIYCETV